MNVFINDDDSVWQRNARGIYLQLKFHINVIGGVIYAVCTYTRIQVHWSLLYYGRQKILFRQLVFVWQSVLLYFSLHILYDCTSNQYRPAQLETIKNISTDTVVQNSMTAYNDISLCIIIV